MTSLKPCPFCGGEATVERIGRSGYYYVACNTAYCCDYGKFDTESEVIAAWNTRAELGSGTCRIIASSTDGLCSDNPRQWFKLSCGHSFMLYGLDVPVACAVCGKRVSA